MSKEYNERIFRPGKQLHIRDSWKRNAAPLYLRSTVNIPGRLHFGVLDFTKMAPGLGGGGLGISTDTVRNQISVKISSKPGSCTKPSCEHLVKLFCKIVGYNADNIAVDQGEQIKHKHSGFGSNVSFNTAVIAGLNALFGCPFSSDEVWDIVTQNYVENTPDGENLYFGLDTGVGEACFIYGGLVWVDARYGQGRYVGNVNSENLWVVTAVGDRVKLTGDILQQYGEDETLSGDTETALVASHFAECERKYGADLKRFIKNKMTPALLSNNLPLVLELGWEMNQMSNMKVLEGIYKTEVLQHLNVYMQEKGALYAGMSSAGPGFFMFAKDESCARELGNCLEADFGEYFSGIAVGKAGTKMSIDLEPSLNNHQITRAAKSKAVADYS